MAGGVRLPRLQVSLNRGPDKGVVHLGELLWIPSERVAAFEWNADFKGAATELSPLLMRVSSGIQKAKRSPFEGLHPLFSDSIPDGFGLRLMNRGLVQAGHVLAQITPLDRLSWVGERGVGALAFKPSAGDFENTMLASIGEAAEMAAKAEVESFKDVPVAAIRAGGSALGARPKFWAAVDPGYSKVVIGDQVSPPTGYIPSLLKFAPTKGDKNEPYLEATCLELADKFGVRAAKGKLLSHKAGAALAIERFDRLPSGERIHTQSAAALLGIDFREAGLDYVHLCDLARRLGAETEIERLYRQICFNVALSMRDDHAKNFAFCMSSTGQWTLSPAFDLCPSEGIGRTQEHTTTLNSKGTDITRSDLLKFADKQGLSPQTALDAVEKAREAAAEFESLAVSNGATKTRAREWSKAFTAIDSYLAPIAVPVSRTERTTSVEAKRSTRRPR